MKHTKRLAVLVAGCVLPVIGTMAPASAADNSTRETLTFPAEPVATCEGGAVVGEADHLRVGLHPRCAMLDGIDWRNPRHTFRPQRAG